MWTQSRHKIFMPPSMLVERASFEVIGVSVTPPIR
jgi:hypothetical protein